MNKTKELGEAITRLMSLLPENAELAVTNETVSVYTSDNGHQYYIDDKNKTLVAKRIFMIVEVAKLSND